MKELPFFWGWGRWKLLTGLLGMFWRLKGGGDEFWKLRGLEKLARMGDELTVAPLVGEP